MIIWVHFDVTMNDSHMIQSGMIMFSCAIFFGFFVTCANVPILLFSCASFESVQMSHIFIQIQIHLCNCVTL